MIRRSFQTLKWFAFKDQYFSAIVIGDKPFSNTILTSKVLDAPDHIKSYAAGGVGAG